MRNHTFFITFVTLINLTPLMKTIKTILTLIFALCTLIKMHAQPLPMNQTVIDSLTEILKTQKPDTNKVNTYYLLSRALTLINTSEAIKLIEAGTALAKQINYPIGELKCLEAAAFSYAMIGSYEKALKTNYDATPLCKKFEPTHEVYLLNMMCLLYQKLGDNREAFNWAEKAYHHPLCNNSDVELGQWAAVMQMGQQYEKLNKLDSAVYYAEKCLAFSKINYPAGLGYPLAILSRVSAKRGNLEEAIKLNKQSIEVFKHNHFNYPVFEDETELAQIYYQQNKLDSAQKYAASSLAGATQMNNFPVIRSSAFLLSKIYETKNPSQSLQFLKTSVAANDTITGLEKTKQIKLIELKEKQRVDDLNLSELASKNRIRFNTVIGLLASMLLVALILYRNNRQKQKANMLLQKQKEEIQTQRSELQKSLTTLKATQNQLIQSEKLASLGELTAGIAHEIQNPLNFVNNFSVLSVDLAKDIKNEMHKPEIDKPYVEELLTDLTYNQESINHHGKRAASIVTSMLEHSRLSTGTKEWTDINKLADEYFRLSFHGLRAKDKDFNSDMISHFDKTIPKIEIVPQDVGRVILNLINNAFYAVNEKRVTVDEERRRGLEPQRRLDAGNYSPTVTVSTKKLDTAIEIRVKDNGTGMSEAVRAKVFQPFFTTKPPGQGTGLGLSLAYDIITKGHGGTLRVESIEGVGSEFIIHLSSKA